MQPMNRAAHGLLALSVALSLTACNGVKLVTRTEVVEVARRQYVKLPASMTEGAEAPAVPKPSCVADGKPVLCNGQLLDLIDALMTWGGGLNDKLRAIRSLQQRAGAHE